MSRSVVFEQWLEDGRILRIVQGDLTGEPVDAIVNAANEHLAHGGGVAGAIVRRGGAIIQQESDQWIEKHGPVRTGTAVITGAGKLSARFVIHAVGPVWGSGDEENKLISAVNSALELASSNDLVSISLPAISSGIYRFPKTLCALVILKSITDFLAENPGSSLKEFNMCNIDDATTEIFAAEARRFFAADR